MSKTKYHADITDNKHWVWTTKAPPEAHPDAPPGSKQCPVFQRGDTLKLCAGGHAGIHKITLRSEPYSARTPFAYPFDLHTFTYHSDRDVLTIVGEESSASKTVWEFDIQPEGGASIDPEFQVGPGGSPTGD